MVHLQTMYLEYASVLLLGVFKVGLQQDCGILGPRICSGKGGLKLMILVHVTS